MKSAIKHYAFGKGMSPYHRVIRRAKAEGFTLPSPATLTALETFINTLVAESIFYKLDYLRVSALNNVNCKDLARINFLNPEGMLASPGSATVYNASGFKGNKTVNGSLYTGVKLSDLKKTNPLSATLLFVIATATTQYLGYLELSGSPSLGGRVMTISNSNSIGQTLFGQSNTAIDMSGNGLKALTKKDTIRVAFNKDVKTFYSGVNGSWPPSLAHDITENRSFNVYAEATFSLSIIGSYLTESEVEFIREKFNIYLTTIGLTAFA